MFKVGLTPSFIGFMFRNITICHIHFETIFCYANTKSSETSPLRIVLFTYIDPFHIDVYGYI